MARAKNLPPGISVEKVWGNERYRVRVTWQGKRITEGRYPSLIDAVEAQKLAEEEIRLGVYVPPAERKEAERRAAEEAAAAVFANSRTVQQLADEWISWHKNNGNTQGTVYTYERRLNQYFLPEFGSQPVTSIEPAEIQQWYDRVVAAKGVDGAREHLRTVKQLFRYATGQAIGLPYSFEPWLSESPVKIIVPRGRPKKKKDQPVLSVDEINAIAALMPTGEGLAVLLAGYCALRIGEVAAVRRNDLTRQGEQYWLRIDEQVQARGSGLRIEALKTGSSYGEVPVPVELTKQVEQHLEHHTARPGDSFLFPRHFGSSMPFNPNTLRSHYMAAKENYITKIINDDDSKAADRERAEYIRPGTFHGLRHTAATLFGRQGATNADLMAFGRWSDPKTVAVYQHSSKRRLADLQERALGGDQQQ